ncbi:MULTISPECIES: phosphoglucosamine mutase [Reichenbachiella]|uniref:Phosphomannomutase n=1 Tax=Reichenbachiella agariperforans TaxID=156994 RepID=A0A1M6TJN5_REIAG|nr:MULTISPECIES: phosphoglucosamine mutase [Reichenbachiella]MBU2915465.1 phosphoglucosamine mutase [Reichenbachiella agariperforans]RJE71467.1 phosphoglucosamine mutase [Reichenbachiella sp. MSK19-1]SHK57109.1 phosphomannomutase [Reichenbachiella agariperforans]
MTLIKSISGIRGTIGGKEGEALTPNDVVKYAAAFGQWTKENSDSNKIVIGRDARPSGDLITKMVSGTLQSLGIDVVDLGLSTTPTVEMAVPTEQASGGIIITASHNPNGWNALKLLNKDGEFISDVQGQRVLEIAEQGEIEYVQSKDLGSFESNDTYIDFHIDRILELGLVDVEAIQAANMKIAVDAVNSTGAIAIPKLLDKLGVQDYKILFDEPNGLFPHNPEPLPENITHICNEVENNRYNLGIVVDPDVDRLAFVSDSGEPFGEEYSLVMIADYVLKNTPGNTVSNMSSTRALKDVTLKNGGSYEASAVGEVNVVTKMKETNAIIGGEGNGGIIYPELHYGRDALVGIALFLTALAKFGKSSSFMRATYPNYHISKNKIDLTKDIDVDDVLAQIQKKYEKHPINTVDGVKIDFDSEWVHLRKSNTEPIIRIYSESESKNTAEVLAKKIMMDIKEIVTEKIED